MTEMSQEDKFKEHFNP